MSKIEWTVKDSFLKAGNFNIPCVPDLANGYNQGSGIKYNPGIRFRLKRIFWPFVKWRNNLLFDGFIGQEIGKLIRKYINDQSVFLEIGCGDMNLRKFVPENIWYNALDLELSDFLIVNALKRNQKVNLVLASASKIPVPSDSVSLIVTSETLEHIPEIDRAVQEIYRIARRDAILICSIPNNYGYKYRIKGPNWQHINNWTYEGFIEYMKSYRFEFVEGFMKGRWIPLPLWMTKFSFQLPLTAKQEFYNTNFFYVFRAGK